MLLAFKLIGWLDSLYLEAVINWITHKAFFLAFIIVMYLALVQDRITIAYYFDWWDISPYKKIKVYLLIKLFPSLSLAQSELIYLTSLFVETALNLILRFKVSAKYQNI